MTGEFSRSQDRYDMATPAGRAAWGADMLKGADMDGAVTTYHGEPEG